jgi:hypothetical protein
MWKAYFFINVTKKKCEKHIVIKKYVCFSHIKRLLKDADNLLDWFVTNLCPNRVLSYWNASQDLD